MNPFAVALYQIALEEGNTLTLEPIRNTCLQTISQGNVKALINSSVNGKTFTFNISKPADVLFAEVSWAIRQFNTGNITNLRPDFTLI